MRDIICKDNNYQQWQIMEEHLPNDLVTEYKEAFQMLDRKSAGKISVRDVATVVCSIGIRLSDRDLLEFVKRVLGFGEINFTAKLIGFSEFLATMTSIITECVPEDEVLKIFQIFDKDGDGFISPEELRQLLLQLGDDVTEKELEAMMQEADKDGDGMVSLEEFIHVMTSSTTSNNSITESNLLPKILISTTPTNSTIIGDVAEESADSCEDSCQSWSNLDSARSEDDCQSVSDMSNSDYYCGSLNGDYKKANPGKRRRSVVDWLKGRPGGCDEPVANYENRIINLSSASSSSLPTLQNSSKGEKKNAQQRRHSSIGKTLKNGRNALVATARTIRKFSG